MNNEFYLADTIDLIEEVLASGGEFRMYPRGTSMLPLIVQGEDSVVLRRSDKPLKRLDIAFYRRDSGQFVLHRIVKVNKKGIYTMCGDNQLVLEPGIRPDQIIGYVSDIYKKDVRLDRRSLKNRIYLFFWGSVFFRKVVKFPRRALGKSKSILLKIFGKKS